MTHKYKRCYDNSLKVNLKHTIHEYCFGFLANYNLAKWDFRSIDKDDMTLSLPAWACNKKHTKQLHNL